jgi:hypothetical protein
VSQQLEEVGKKIIEELKNIFFENNLNDSGEAMYSLEYKVEGHTLKINGLKRVLFLQFGREPGTFPPVDVIRKWVESKLNITGDKEINQVAFLIGRKIKEKGTDILTDKTKGLQIELTLEEINNVIFGEMAQFEAANIVNGIFNTWESDKELYK